MTIHFAPEAEADLAALVGYLHERNPTAAADVSRRILAIIERLAAGEFDGPVATLTNGEAVHSWAVPPMKVYYRREPDLFWVLRIYHQARPPITR